MKNFIRLFVVIAIIAISTQSYAQRAGIIMGLNLSTQLIKDDDNSISKDLGLKMNPGVHLGVIVEIPVYKFLSLETGLIITTKGFKYLVTNPLGEAKYNNYLFYLDLPITIKGTLDLDAVKLYAAFGPYLGLGVYGFTETKITSIIKDDTSTDETKWGSDKIKDDYKRFDFGLTFGGGVELGVVPIFLGVSYDLGLINISPDSDNGHHCNNRVLKISLGVKFGGGGNSSGHKRSRR